MVKNTDVVYLALLKATSLCTFAASSIFTFSDRLPAVKSNTVFSKITVMVLEKYSLEIEETLVYLCFGIA